MKQTLWAGFLIIVLLCLSVSAQEKPAPTSEPQPVSYGLVIDNSGSIRTLLDRVIAVVSNVIESNGAQDEAFLLTFVDTPKIVIRQEFTDRKSDLEDAAQNMFVEGGQTAILDAVKISAQYLGKNARTDGQRGRALVLITDGEDRDSGSKIEDVLKLLKENNIRVFVIAMAEGKIYTKVIDRLTKETGGVKYSPRTKAELTATATQISAAIRTK
ncbi:MAG TPA: VWA domain-containing protein [Pyrinomonadaceae bacterium]|nr:VWA domain-containing protein [Pyrinomonadaceae bacterium]